MPDDKETGRREEIYVLMPEEEWQMLCLEQCRARRAAYPGSDDECDHDGRCGECRADAVEFAPKKYRVTKEQFDAAEI